MLTSAVVPSVGYDVQNAFALRCQCDSVPAEPWKLYVELVFVLERVDFDGAVGSGCITEKYPAAAAT